MLRVNNRPIFMDDNVSMQILIDAIDEIRDVCLSHCFLFQLVIDIVGQVSHLLQPTLKEGKVLLPVVVELSLLLLFVDRYEVLLEDWKVVLLVVVEGMKNSHVLGDGSAPLRVLYEVLSVIEEILDLNGSQTQEKSSLFERASDSKDRTLEIIHPMQPKQAKGHIVLFNVFELGLNIDLFEVNLRLEMVVVLVKVDHILRNVIANDSLDIDSVLQQSFPDSGRGQSISAANIKDGKGLLFLFILLSDGFNKVIDCFFVEVALKMVDFRIGPVKGFIFCVEFYELFDGFVHQKPVNFLRSFLVLLSVATWIA